MGQGPPPPEYSDPDEPTQQVSHWARLRRAADLNLDDPGDSQFGDYQLLEKIGTGGMGVVYRARQVSLDREVALKLLSFDPFSAEALISRFRTEARHAGRLQHPNIVPVYEIGSYENLYYFSMSLVRGPTLRQWIKRNPDRPGRIVAGLMRTIAEAVQYAHQVGILHLDLKPGNVLIDERGEPQVSDFGLARRVGESAEDGRETVVAGTPAFMAPEQSLGDPAALSIATDIWGLGGILYMLLTGRPPLDGAAAGDLRWQVPPPRAREANVDADLDAICCHCLQKDPAARYANARELADDLQRYLDGRPVSVRRQGPVERLRGWARREPRAAALTAGLALALLAGLAGTTVLWRQSEVSRALAESTLWSARRASALAAAGRGDPLAGLPALVANVAEAEAAGQSDGPDADRRRIKALLEQSPRQIAGWSFDGEGRSLAFAENGGLLLAGLRSGELVAIDVASGAQRWKITPPLPPTPWGPSFVGRSTISADGRFAVLYPSGSSGVARPDTSHMQRVELATGVLTQPPAAFGPLAATSYSADGSRALLRDPDGGLQLWALDPWQPIGERFQRPALRACLVPNRGTLLACAGDGFAAVEMIDAVDGEPRDQLAFAAGAELAGWNVDADAGWLALGSSGGELLLYGMSSGSRQLIPDAGEDALGDLSFSNGLLAVSSGGGSVRLLDVERRAWMSRPLRSGAARSNSAIYDPDTRWLLVNDGRAVLWQLGLSGGRLEQPESASVLRHRGALSGFHAAAMDAANGLVATHGSEGDLKLFRLPQRAVSRAAGATLIGQPGQPTPALGARVDGTTLVFDAAAGRSAETVALPARPYLLQGTADGRRWLLAAGSRLLVVERPAAPGAAAVHDITLPASIQYLLLPSVGNLAVLGWIGESGPLEVIWRTLDMQTRRWLDEPSRSVGLPAGVRLSTNGRHLALWQGRGVQVRRLPGGTPVASIEVEGRRLQITDVAFTTAVESELLVATSDRSMILPATLEHWRIRDGASPERIARTQTPSGNRRVLDLGAAGWLAHGPRVAIYRSGERHELADLGPEWGEVVAVSPDQRWAALGQADALLQVDLHLREQLSTRRTLSLPDRDVLASLAFSPDGTRLLARSHFGVVTELDVEPDARAVPVLQLEANDLVPTHDRPATEANAIQRQARDPGPPQVADARPAATVTRDPAAGAAQIDLRAYANVPERQWFQGSWRGLGITDSASWPHGLLRLRGIGFELGPALQLAPAGVALGGAVFPERSGPIPLPPGELAALSLLVANQQAPKEGGLRLAWLDAAGATLFEQPLAVPTTYDGEIHATQRGNRPRGDVALVLRSAESRIRGGGSVQLFIYHVRVDAPQTPVPIAAVELRAPGATPLLLALTVH